MNAGLYVESDDPVRCPACRGTGVHCDSTGLPFVNWGGGVDPCGLCRDAIACDADGYTLIPRETADVWLDDRRAKRQS